MLVPLTIASRTRVLSERLRGLTRPSGSNALQRYYLDVALVLVAVGLIFEADLRGTVFERNSVGGLSADPLLLSTPILFALAAALVILRILPWVYRLVAWLTYDRFPLSIAAPLRYVSRTVGPAARLTILLMLGAALGTFAASYADTVERSLTERIQYDTGVEHRVALADGAYSSPAGVERRLSEAEGVDRLSAVHRSGVAAGRSIGTASAVSLLAIEPRDARAMLWFREDLSELSFDELMRLIDVPPTGRGVGVPDDTQTLRLWVDLTEGESEQTIWIRVRDGNGRYFTAGQIEVPHPDLGWTPIDIEFGRQIIGSGAVAALLAAFDRAERAVRRIRLRAIDRPDRRCHGDHRGRPRADRGGLRRQGLGSGSGNAARPPTGSSSSRLRTRSAARTSWSSAPASARAPGCARCTSPTPRSAPARAAPCR